MTETGTALTAEQWDRIRQIVHDEALRARVAATFLPLYGPLPGATETVPRNLLGISHGRLAVNDHDVLRIGQVSINVTLRNHMLADPEMAAAGILFRRAAEIIARYEDAIIFNGRPSSRADDVRGVGGLDAAGVRLGGADSYEGLVTLVPRDHEVAFGGGAGSPGVEVFQAVVEAILKLEEAGHVRPFACVLSNDLFTAINIPLPNSMVLPRDSIPPYLDGGPLLRTSCLERGTGLVLSLSGEPAEIVVPSDISVRYLHANDEGHHVFRVSQRFVLRVKEPHALALIRRGAGAAAA